MIRNTLGLAIVWGTLGALAFTTLSPACAQSSADNPPPVGEAVVSLENDEPGAVAAKKRRLKFEKNGAIVFRKSDDWEIKCDVYVPEGKGPFPAILAVHGGAWRQGTKFALLRHAWKMAGAGYVVVAINYRHAPEYPFPAQIHDCKYAIRWMKANARQYKIDANRIGAFGYSAGGHLVSLLGTTDEEDDLEGTIDSNMEKFDSRVRAVAAGGAPCEFSWIEEDSPLLGYWLGGSRNEKPENYLAASPTSYVTKDDPPFFLFHGERDVLVPSSSSLKLHQKLESKGVKSQHFVAPGSGHFGVFSDLNWMDKAIEFFDSNLKK